MKRLLSLLAFLLFLSGNAFAACTQSGGYPYTTLGCLNAADLNAAMNFNPGANPPQNNAGLSAGYGKYWLDTSHRDSAGNVLRQCTVTTCNATYNALEWVTIGQLSSDGIWQPSQGQYVYTQPTSGSTLTASGFLAAYMLDPTSTLATLQIITPPAAFDGEVFTISTTASITALTVSPSISQTVVGGSVLLAANGGVSFRFRATDSTWRRIQ